MNNDMLKQAKLKALRLLSDMDRTEAQLRTKLKQKDFSEEVIEQALEYVKSFGYINDANYAERFVANRQSSKSRREIYASLCEKGVSREIAELALENGYAQYDEVETIRAIATKRHYSETERTDAEKKKLFDYLVRRGFRYEDIRQVIQVSYWNA